MAEPRPVPEWMKRLPDTEAAARRCLASMGVPSWGSEESPGAAGRYGLVFMSGRRALVLPIEDGTVSTDAMAAARCDYLMLAGGGEGETGWGITGFVYWFEVDGDGLTGEVPCSSLCPRPVQDLPEVASRPSCYRLARFLGSLKLLFLGDPVTPPPADPGSISEGV